MTIARKQQFDPARPPWIHCVSRCVRRAFLCGQDFSGRDISHRKTWVEQRLRLLARTAALQIGGFSVMDNHLHLVVRMNVKQAAGWSAEEVVRRYVAIWPRERDADGQAVAPKPDVIRDLADNLQQVDTWRARLCDLGWTMKALKENISRRANHEDGCSGAFWEGRYKSVPLLDQTALLACMAYVDLNPIRAKIVDRPETSRFTGAYERIQARKTMRAAARLRRLGKNEQATALLRKAGIDARINEADKACWLTPITCCLTGGRPLSLDEYLTLVDTTGRVVRQGKRGAIPPELAPILQRLDIDIDNWLACMLGYRQFLGAAVGRWASRMTEAGRRGLRWIQNRCGLFAGESQPSA